MKKTFMIFVILGIITVFCTGNDLNKIEISKQQLKSINTYAGNLSIEKKGYDAFMKLNGKVIKKVTIGSSFNRMNFFKRYKSVKFEIIVISNFYTGGSSREGDNVYFAVIVEKNGRYQVSEEMYYNYDNEIRNLSFNNNQLKFDNKFVKIEKKGKIIKNAFYNFFEKFKVDNKFQLSRVKFPFKIIESTYEGDEEIFKTTKTYKNKWDYLKFKKTVAISYKKEIIDNNTVKVYEYLDGQDFFYLFKRIRNKWFLIQGENFMM